MKKTGNDELDFIREASSEVFDFQAKFAIRGLLAEIIGVGIIGGLISLLSVTVALWVFVILGGIVLIQALLFFAFQLSARRIVEKNTRSTSALDAFTASDDMDFWK